MPRRFGNALQKGYKNQVFSICANGVRLAYVKNYQGAWTKVFIAGR